MDSQRLEKADILDNLCGYLSENDDIARKKMSTSEFVEYISAIRYAIAVLRGGDDK